MNHLRNVALFVVTIWAALIAASAVGILLSAIIPGVSDLTMAISYLGFVLITTACAGCLLMFHLTWSRRFLILAVVPCSIALPAIAARAVSADSSRTLLENLALMFEVHVEWLVAIVGILVGATIARWRIGSETAGQPAAQRGR